MIVRNTIVLQRILKNSPYTTYPCIKSKYVYMYGNILLPYNQKSVFGLRICYSFGKEVDGGPIPTSAGGLNCDEWIEFAKSLLQDFDISVLTIRKWCKPHARFLKCILNSSLRKYIRVSEIYPRIINTCLYKGFDEYWRNISKKARNRYRYFKRNGGFVAIASPKEMAIDILRVNCSSIVRQGRILPKNYRIPKLVAKTIELWERDIRDGLAKFYVAVLNKKVVGYALITMLNGHAYFSRFLVHSEYTKYGVGNGLLIDVIRDLMKNSSIKLIQYGYWRSVNPGINHFLQQHGFREGVEYVVLLSKRMHLEIPVCLYKKYIDLSNTFSPPRKLLYTYSVILDKIS